MATYRFDNISGTDPALLANFLPTLDNRLTKVTDSSPYDISINGDAIFRIASNSYKIILNGNEIASGGDVFQDFKIWSIIDDNFILIRISRRGEDRFFTIAWITDGNDNNFIAGYWATSAAYNYFDMSLYSFYRVSDNTSGFTFAKMINFAAPTGSIAYSSIAPFTNGGSLAFYGEDILSCSTIALESQIALPDGNIYRAISTNAMIKIDT